jgi:two-component system cell cycle sensor histidine kinase/response regulator CckA
MKDDHTKEKRLTEELERLRRRVAELEKADAERRKAEEALREIQDELERRVEERTAELAAATRELEQEIAERRWATEAVWESEERFELAVAGSNGALWDFALDPDAPLGNPPDQIYVSRRLQGFLGFEESDAPSSAEAWRERVDPDDLAVFMMGMRDHVEGRTDRHAAEFRIRHKDGSIRWLDSCGKVQRDEKGRPVRFTGISWDITERKRTEEALRASEERYRTLFMQSRDVIYITTRDGTIIDINQAASDLFGYTREEFTELNVEKTYVDPDERRRFQEEIEAKGAVRDFEVKLRKKKGAAMNCLLTSTVRRANDGTVLGYQGTIRDITERRRAELEKEKLQAQLLQVQKMEALGTLTAGVAHDFNNILTSIQGYTELAMMKIDEADPMYGNLSQVHHASLRAADLVRQLLLFSRKQPMTLTSLNINQLVENLLKMLERLIGEDIAVETDLDRDVWTVQGDAGNIEHVVMNLAVNARDAMPKGGRLTIKSENVIVDEEFCKAVPEARPARFTCLAVTDTGIGMEQETLQHIFEPFFTTKETGRGTGLGLSVVYGIVKQHDGWVNVYSEPGQGTTFRVYLPACFGRPEEKTAEAVSLEELQGNGERILLVEDDDEVRTFAAKALVANGHQVFEAANAEEAVTVFEREAGRFDLLFSDVVLPDGNGLELAEEVLARKPELPILLSTGYADEKAHWPLIRERGFPFLQKPYALAVLLQAVQGAMERD